MKEIAFSQVFIKKIKVIGKRDPKLSKKIKTQINLFKLDRNHPSLRLHKLKGELHSVWSLSVTKSFRLLLKEDHQYYFFDLGEHDEIYQK